MGGATDVVTGAVAGADVAGAGVVRGIVVVVVVVVDVVDVVVV